MTFLERWMCSGSYKSLSIGKALMILLLGVLQRMADTQFVLDTIFNGSISLVLRRTNLHCQGLRLQTPFGKLFGK
jgi:hypothetical protein